MVFLNVYLFFWSIISILRKTPKAHRVLGVFMEEVGVGRRDWLELTDNYQ